MTTPSPLLQIALDNLSLDQAFTTTRLIAADVDIIEAGTILCISEGLRAVSELKALYPQHTVLADAKIADAGDILATLCFEAGADWVTVICCADINTVKSALTVAHRYGGDVQIELTGRWQMEQAQQWFDIGIRQLVYHRSRDAQAAGINWCQQDIALLQQLCGMGFRLTITGGLVIEDLPLFRHLPIHAFIAGRSIRDAEDPAAAAAHFRQAIRTLWG